MSIPRRSFLQSSFAAAAFTALPRPARRGRWKYLRIGDDKMLFDIPNDPGERSDLDIYQPRALASLEEEFRRWNDQMLPRPAPRKL